MISRTPAFLTYTYLATAEALDKQLYITSFWLWEIRQVILEVTCGFRTRLRGQAQNLQWTVLRCFWVSPKAMNKQETVLRNLHWMD